MIVQSVRFPAIGRLIVISFSDLSIFNSMEKENLAHLMASMHLVLRHQEGCDVKAGRYGHLTNTTYEIFVEK